jgi:hypothetical protein
MIYYPIYLTKENKYLIQMLILNTILILSVFGIIFNNISIICKVILLDIILLLFLLVIIDIIK